MIKLYVTILLTIKTLIYENDLKSLIGVGYHLQRLLRLLFGLSEYHIFFISAVFEVSGASILFFRVCKYPIQKYIILAC
jgi:hypothetical protein